MLRADERSWLVTSNPPLPTQRVLGERYRVERLIGVGGMAEVYAAQDLRHHRDVAVKVLKPELASALATERFLREVEIVAHLSHPHILPVFDSGAIDGQPYYVMPLVRGETLKQRLERDRQLSLGDSLRIAAQVAEALAHAHARGVVHRDIKPENILIEDGQPRVADFGVASAVTAAGGERLTSTGIAVGTPLYMSPEQAGGERQIDARSDIYSLGCVLYEMIGGEPPFLGSTAQAILARKATQDVPSLRILRDTVPAPLDRVVRKALARSRADRFASAEEFAGALRRCATESAPPNEQVADRFVSIRLGMLAFGALVAVGIGLSVVTARRDAINADRTSEIRAVAVMPIEAGAHEVSLAGEIHARLIDELSHVSALRVTQAFSSTQVLGTTTSIPTVAKRLNVEALIQASARPVGDTLHLHVRLVGGDDGSQLWAQEFTTDTRQLDRLQKEVTHAVVTYLQLPLMPKERERLRRFRVVDPRANESYQRGLRLSSSFDPDRFQKSIAAFEEAIRLDPADPAPYVALAAMHAVMGLGHDTLPPANQFRRAKELAQRALEIDPDNADAHSVMGGIHHLWDWDWLGAEREFKLALRSNPGSALAHSRYGVFLRTTGPADSAIAELERARRIDPLLTINLADLALAYLWAGRPDSGMKWAREAVDLDPSSPPAHMVLGTAFLLGRQHDSSIVHHRRAAELNPQFRAHLAQAYAAGGRNEEFDRLLAGLTEREKRRLSPSLARAYVIRGDFDAAFKWLDRAIEDHVPWIDNARLDVVYGQPPSDRRYQARLERLALPPWP